MYLFDTNNNETLGHEEFVVLTKCALESIFRLAKDHRQIHTSDVLDILSREAFKLDKEEEQNITPQRLYESVLGSHIIIEFLR